MVSKGAREVVPISMIQGRKRNSINGELVIDTDPSYREEISPTTPADIYNHHNTVTVNPNQKQKDTINITDDPAATDNPSAWKEPTGTDDGAGFDLTTAGTTSIKTSNVSNTTEVPEKTTNNSVFVPDDTKINVTNLNKLIFVPSFMMKMVMLFKKMVHIKLRLKVRKSRFLIMDVCTNLTVKNITRSIQVIQIIHTM